MAEVKRNVHIGQAIGGLGEDVNRRTPYRRDQQTKEHVGKYLMSGYAYTRAKISMEAHMIYNPPGIDTGFFARGGTYL